MIRWFILLSIAIISCNGNVYESLAPKEGDAYYLEQTKIHLNKGEYEEAVKTLEKVKNKNSDTAFMEVAVVLGLGGLSFWQILFDVVDATSAQTTNNDSSSGMDKIFDLIGDSVFGTGEEREKKVTALSDSINLLETSDTSLKRIKNFKCLLSGILTLPSIIDGTAALATATSALQDIANLVTDTGNTGNSVDQCGPSLDGFDIALKTLTTVQANLELIMKQIEGCDFLKFATESTELNQAQEMLKKVTANADLGCPTIPCDNDLACAALQLPCVKRLTGDGTALEGDGEIAICELLQNCRTQGACF